jgi:hypothetical protein
MKQVVYEICTNIRPRWSTAWLLHNGHFSAT